VGAALIGSMLNIAFASQSESISDPARVLTRTNRILQGRLENSFVTACSLYLDPAYGSLIYANAGHPPPLLWRAASKEMVRLSNAGTILGPFPDSVYENSTLELTQGDRIILYTDGIVETRSKRGELFGEEQLITFIEKHATDSAETTADRLIKHLFHWSGRDGNSSLDDDLTLVIVDLAGVRAVAPESQVHVIHFGKPF
jgi:serine phosphatase RsbU (regulator of sigma subunit)